MLGNFLSIVVIDVFNDQIQWNVEKYCYVICFQVCYGFVIVYGIVVGVDYFVLNCQFQQNLFFDMFQCLIVIVVDNVLQCVFGLFLNQQIGVDKFQFELFGQEYVNCVFVVFGYVDEYDVLLVGIVELVFVKMWVGYDYF